jgi:outer membrane protein assembly factor BamC
MHHRHLPVAVLLIGALVGCSGKVLEGRKVDYKSAKTGKQLEVPEDLSQPPVSDRYALPDAGPASYSQYNKEGTAQAKPKANALLPQVPGLRIERAGTQRWLVVQRPAEQVWPALKEFWQETGFIIDREAPDVGIIETDWAENRAKVPPSTLRRLLGKVIDQAYSTPERDKFRSRLERSADGKSSEIYITHRGMYEAYKENNRSGQNPTIWQPRPTEPELEMEMLARLMMRLGASDTVVAEQRREAVKLPEARAALGKLPDGTPILEVKDDFDRAWRRVGLALDRLGFTVQDRDRSSGLYFVRYQNPDAAKKDSSFWSFFKSGAKTPEPDQYRVAVNEADTGSEVRVLNAKGEPEKSNTASRILALLKDDLR